MKTRLTLIFAALVVLLGVTAWVVRDRSSQLPVPAMQAAMPVTYRLKPTPIEVTLTTTPDASATMPAAVASVESPAAPSADGLPMVHIDPAGKVEYVARAGDTVSQIAIALLGSDSKEHRDAVIAANVSLQENPDRVLDGNSYSITRRPILPTIETKAAETPTAAITAVTAPVTTDVAPAVKPSESAKATAARGPKLEYIAQPGETVAVLAGNLLGGNTPENRQAIISVNPSLQTYPNHLVAGQSYTIAAPKGLIADPNAPQVKTPPTQPDADTVLQLAAGRTLRYTAKTGDTVTKIAIALLGSDSRTNQDLVIKSNPSLKQDPDHLVAGETYWIPAPTADSKK